MEKKIPSPDYIQNGFPRLVRSPIIGSLASLRNVDTLRLDREFGSDFKTVRRSMERSPEQSMEGKNVSLDQVHNNSRARARMAEPLGLGLDLEIVRRSLEHGRLVKDRLPGIRNQ